MFLIVLLELIFAAGIILLLYRLKARLGLAPLYVLIGSNQLFVTLLGTKLDVDILGGLSIPVGPSIIFTAGFFAILLIYIKEGVQTAQKLIIAIVVTNLSLTVLTSFSNWNEIIMTGSSSVLFYISFRIFMIGMLTLILDAFVLIILYEFLYTKLKILNLYSRLTLTMLIILNFDAFIFVTGSFWDQPDYSSRLLSHVVGKTIAALFFSWVLYIYLRYLDKGKYDQLASDQKGQEDIFSILTYKGRFEKIKKEKAISEEQLQKIISDKTSELEKAIWRFTILSATGKTRIDLYSSAEQTREFLLKVQEAFEVDVCTIHMLKGDELELLTCVGMEEDEKESLLDATTPYFNKIIKFKNCLAIEDTSEDKDIQEGKKAGKIKFIYTSCLGAPMTVGKNVIGILKLYSRNKKRSFTYMEKEQLQLAASQVASSIENSKLFEQNEKQKEILVKQIVARKKVETAIKESEEKYRNLIERASDAIIVYKFDGTILSCNQSACDLLGYKEEEMIKLKLNDLVFEEDLRKLPFQFDAIKAGKTAINERRVRAKDGKAIEVELNTKLMPDGTLMVVARDLTERKKAEKEKEQLLLRNQQTLDTMLDGYLLVDHHGKIIDSNPAYCKMSGYSREELLKKNLTDVEENMTSRDVETQFKIIAEKKYLQFESRNKRKDGSVMDVEISASILYTNGEPLFSGFIKDITDRKKTQEKIKTYNEQLRQLTAHLQTIREEERFRIGREVHDGLGQYLTVLKMDVSRLKKNIEAGKHKEEDFFEILNELDNCLTTVRKISTDLRPSILDDLGIIAALEWQAEDFEKRTEISTKFYSNVSELSLPPTYTIGLFRIFQESLTNVARHAEAKEVKAVLERDNNSVVMTITDNGKGFERKSISQKRTLGLLGMRERTQLMNGKYEINSEPGKGTEVKVTIPV